MFCKATDNAAHRGGEGFEDFTPPALDGCARVIVSGLPGGGNGHVGFKPPPANSGASLILFVFGSFMV